MSDDKRHVILCSPITVRRPPEYTKPTTGVCEVCGARVWVTRGARDVLAKVDGERLVACDDCGNKMMAGDEPVEIAPVSPVVFEDIARELGSRERVADIIEKITGKRPTDG